MVSGMGVRLGLVAILAAGFVAASAVLADSRAVGAGARPAASKPDTGIVDIDTALRYEGDTAAGTGMVLSGSGLVLTNNHVIRGATSISVTDSSTGKRYSATVLGYDVSADVALLRLKKASTLHTVAVGNSSSLRVGEHVTAVGNAGGVGGAPSVTTGTVTALHRSITVGDGSGGSERLIGMVMSTAPVEPGDSGGALLDGGGQVVGMITASSQIGFRGASNGGFAIPVNSAVSIARQIEAGRSSATVHVGPTAFLGVLTQPSSRGGGAFIAAVEPGTAAAKAGLERGDVITSFAGHAVSSAQQLTTLVTRIKPGQKVRLRWIDAFGNSHSATARPTAGPPQ